MTCTVRNANRKSRSPSRHHGQRDTTRDVGPCGGRGVKGPSAKPARNRQLDHAGAGPSATLGKTSHQTSQRPGNPRCRRVLAALDVPVVGISSSRRSQMQARFAGRRDAGVEDLSSCGEDAGGQSACGVDAYRCPMDACVVGVISRPSHHQGPRQMSYMGPGVPFVSLRNDGRGRRG
ncbi:uncharacterized protein BDZ99DRAFT_457848 [Mytilinidion resinicola]|uniref:Uncharacterized protein n=1 Tax=Mytilinidion resinicola TaxID=574789 RepID=A0A6A6Z6P1_9PEZI|nr:uncharacterized protein BDZ99DRAFT_457848 [Mytilinidion resinicola]KAF2815905.1 hypothetical protein BDZ99DRAFT_457848 [Mytilinidion resinicola]